MLSQENYHFTAPVRGLYSFTISTRSSNSAHVRLVVNGEKLLSTDGGTDWGGDAITAVLMLEANDRVAGWKYSSSHSLDESDGAIFHYNTFSGFMYTQLLQ